MFTPAEREALRDALVAAARDDARITAAALTGSAALLALACVRHGLPAAYARGAHDLAAEVLAPLEAALVGSLDAGELERALSAVVDGLHNEARHVDGDLADRLAAPLAELAELSSRPGSRRPSDTCPG